jgi:hypothetical protein
VVGVGRRKDPTCGVLLLLVVVLVPLLLLVLLGWLLGPP